MIKLGFSPGWWLHSAPYLVLLPPRFPSNCFMWAPSVTCGSTPPPTPPHKYHLRRLSTQSHPALTGVPDSASFPVLTCLSSPALPSTLWMSQVESSVTLYTDTQWVLVKLNGTVSNMVCICQYWVKSMMRLVTPKKRYWDFLSKEPSLSYFLEDLFQVGILPSFSPYLYIVMEYWYCRDTAFLQMKR